MRLHPEKLGGFLEAAYCLETDDQTWFPEVMKKARAVSGWTGPIHGALYDASDIADLQLPHVSFVDASPAVVEGLKMGIGLFTPSVICRTFRSVSAERFGSMDLPEMRPMLDTLDKLGYSDAVNINGLDPSGIGAYFAIWSPRRAASPGQMAIYRRMAHHLGAAYRCRRRLRDCQVEQPHIDPTVGAEAILDSHRRVVHAVGEAREKDAQAELLETSAARDLARRTKDDASLGLRHWRPLTSARWTLVDSFERGGARYVVARENQSRVRGLTGLTDRERQVIAYLAVGQSTKEAAYALGISDGTVRVLAARAAARLGARSRRELLDHADVRGLRPDCQVPAEAHRLHGGTPRR